MSTAAKRTTRVLVTTGSTLLALLGAMAGLLSVQARRARTSIGLNLPLSDPRAEGRFGGNDGEPLQLAMLGDSLAVGIGADSPAQTAAAILARGLAVASGKPVELNNVALPGGESESLSGQVQQLLHDVPKSDAAAEIAGQADPRVAVIIVGANDVTRLNRVADAVKSLTLAVRTLRAAGWEVVVATCPDLGTIRPLRHPLRFFARRSSRLLAAAQTIAVIRAQGRTVSLADTLGKAFSTRPKAMFATDMFHPSSRGYSRAAAVLLPAVCEAAGYWGREARETIELGGAPVTPKRQVEKSRSLTRAAFRAVSRPGAEVTTEPGYGSLTGQRAVIKHRGRSRAVK
ncbi:SGNH/GDSL hydrolase family protein [Saxibacter everestensis]|uniref:SGNH/GDSL hydrolase family protein n=1 Tax=Saxibacter everestensis TaxID=2909229 RepID=A0ABY8QQM4_9MICO|nr:SGNH/GDSL hydrolase family protein [Brevibacteriaceae bacterium ZFBP1038]